MHPIESFGRTVGTPPPPWLSDRTMPPPPHLYLQGHASSFGLKRTYWRLDPCIKGLKGTTETIRGIRQ